VCYGYDGERALERSVEGRGTSRRSLLRGLVAGAGLGVAAGGLGGSPAQALAGTKPWKRVPPDKISIQLWTVRDALWGSPGYDETLRAIAGLGYTRIEQALGYFGRTAGELRSFYDDLGISATSSHDGISASPDALEQKLQNALTLGQRYIVVPYLNSSSLSDWQTWAEQMNTEAAAAKAVGLSYGYHNHAHEFTINLGGGVTQWDVFTSELDPSLVHLEIDLYWAVRGGIESGHGADPEGFAIDVIRDAPQQVLQYHVKDRHASDGDMADLGTGMIDFARIFRAHAVRDYIVENDTPDVSPLQTAEVGYDYLRELRF
jgi:sugar phosphate isomerase/epimerase